MDAPAEDIEGGCLAPSCGMGGGQEPDDTDEPTSGCGSCSNGVVVPWADVGLACHSRGSGTQNVGICHGATWTCDGNNTEVCAGEQAPLGEACGAGFSGF